MAKTAEILEIPATITERGQTTVPAAIRKMLALGKRDKVVFRGLADGTPPVYVWGVQLSGGSLYASDMLNGLWKLQTVR